MYYSENLKPICSVLNEIPSNAAESIKKSVLLSENLESDLNLINTHFSCLVSDINNLETVGLSLIDSVSIIENLKLRMRKIPDGESKYLKVIEKFENILQKNSGFFAIYTIQRILEGKEDYQNLDPRFDQDDVKFFKYAPIIFCGERSFS